MRAATQKKKQLYKRPAARVLMQINDTPEARAATHTGATRAMPQAKKSAPALQ
ncbi:hypothetical protein [Polaromonas sp. P5_D5]